MRTQISLKTAGSATPVEIILHSSIPCPPDINPNETCYPLFRKKKPYPARVVRVIGSFVARPLKSFYNKIAPIGYEDETGFHYGEK